MLGFKQEKAKAAIDESKTMPQQEAGKSAPKTTETKKPNTVTGVNTEKPEAKKSVSVLVDGKDLVFDVEEVKFKMKHVSPGTFIMGEYQENVIAHKVTLSEDFWIGETPVTQELWETVMGANPSHVDLRMNEAPVGNVTWNDCQVFLHKLSELTGQEFCLPTEAKWEFAARGGTHSIGYIYSGSDDIDEVAWYWGNCDKKVHAVKTKKPNELGLYDMSGSVWEWCWDWAADYDANDNLDPMGPNFTNLVDSVFKSRIIRGGCMENDSPACASTARSKLHPSLKQPIVGLRLALFSIKGVIKKQLDDSGDIMETPTANCDVRMSCSASAPDLATTKTVVWMAHCINLPFLPMDKNMKINMELMSMLNDFEHAVKGGDKTATIEIYNKFQDKMKEKFGMASNIPMDVMKICSLSKDLLDVYKMVIEGKRNEDVLSGKGAIRRILKYSIELGSPAKTLDALTDFFVNKVWFDDMPEQEEWHKLALECMMVTGDGEMGNKILGLLEKEGGISDEEKEELLSHAREFRSQIDDSWM